MIEVELPDGRTISVETDDPDVAAKAGKKFLDREKVDALPWYKQVARKVGQGAQAMTDSLTDTMAAPFELAAAGYRATGIPQAVSGKEFFIQPGDISNAARQGTRAIGRGASDAAKAIAPEGPLTADLGPAEPVTTGDKMAAGVGKYGGAALATMVPAARLAQTAAPGSVTQGVAQAMAAQPAAQLGAAAIGGAVEGATDNPWLGMGASIAAPFAFNAAKRIVTPLPATGMDPERARLVALAQQEGIPLSVGQQTGNRTAQLVESVNARHPLAQPIEQAGRTQTQKAFNAAAMRAAGSSADDATEASLRAAKDDIGRTYQGVTSRTPSVDLGGALPGELAAVQAEYQVLLGPQQRPMIQALVDDILNRPSMTGAEYQRIRSKLGAQAKSAGNDAAYQASLKGIQKALDDAFQRSAAPADAAAYNTAKEQYRNLKTIEQAMKTGASEGSLGNVMPSRLAAVTARQPGHPLADLGKLGSAVIRDPIPNSGTAERASLLAMTGAFGAGVEPISAISAAGVPPLVAALMRSKAGHAYLTNQVLPGLPAADRNKLIAAIAAAQATKPDDREHRR